MSTNQAPPTEPDGLALADAERVLSLIDETLRTTEADAHRAERTRLSIIEHAAHAGTHYAEAHAYGLVRHAVENDDAATVALVAEASVKAIDEARNIRALGGTTALRGLAVALRGGAE